MLMAKKKKLSGVKKGAAGLRAKFKTEAAYKRHMSRIAKVGWAKANR